MTASYVNLKPLAVFLLVCVVFATVVLSVHAVAQHGQDAVLVQKCAADPTNLLSRWYDPKLGCYHNVVKLPGHPDAGDEITVIGKDGQEFEKTAFIPKGGRLESIIKWILGKGCVECK